MRTGDVVANRFALETCLGSGGMGVVYRALDRTTNARVALKVLRRSEAGGDPRFDREAELLEQLIHPAIVGFVARGTTAAGEPFLAMQWLEGETLSARLRRGPLSVHETLSLAMRVAGALQTAHDRGIVHRDIKPSNLFLEHGAADRVVVLDFGIARLLEPGRRLTATGQMIGTPGFVSPEQIRAEGKVDARTDVFAFGCVLYQCLTGREAFDTSQGVASILRVLVDAPPPVRSLAPHVPESLETLVARMLEKEPTGRPADGGALLSLLGAVTRGEALPPHVEGAPYATRIAPATLDATIPGTIHTPPAAARGKGKRLAIGLVLAALTLAATAVVLVATGALRGVAALAPTGLNPQCRVAKCFPIAVRDPARASFDELFPKIEKAMQKHDAGSRLFAASFQVEDDAGTTRLTGLRTIGVTYIGSTKGALHVGILGEQGDLVIAETSSDYATPAGALCSVKSVIAEARRAGFTAPMPWMFSLFTQLGSSAWSIGRPDGVGGSARVNATTCKVEGIAH